MKTLRILTISILCFSFFLLVGCKLREEKIYNIEYYINGEKVDYSPKTYKKGDSFDLPIPRTTVNEEFDGWYLYDDYSGKQITKIKTTTTGDLTLYSHISFNNPESEETFLIPIDIKCPNETLIYDYSVSIDEILADINIYVLYHDTKLKLLDKSEYDVDTSNYSEEKGTYEFKVTYEYFELIVTVIVEKGSMDSFQSNITMAPLDTVIDILSYNQENNEQFEITKGLPSLGNPKVLVIPIEFNDIPAPLDMKENLEKAFFGSSEDVGWESLQSYYYKSSYGKLNIEGEVLEPFDTGHTVNYYNEMYSDYLEKYDRYINGLTTVYPESVEWSIINKALMYYDEQIDYSEYDADKDGYIDSLYIVYANQYVNEEDSLWWAFTNEYLTDEFEYYDDVEADYYTFLSYTFLFDEFYGNEIILNSETIIHETGHLLGLQDYYDYDPTQGPNGGIGGADMMDYNVGDHNPFSKLILGWVNPYVVVGKDSTIEIGKFSETGDCVVVFKEFNNSYFDEYLIIDYYTPDGLNEASKGHNGLFTQSGIRIYHVDSTLTNDVVYSVFDITDYNNSFSTHRLIKLVEADRRDDINKNSCAQNTDLFQAGDTYTWGRWYDKTPVGFSIKINSLNDDVASISISFSKS